MPRAYGRYPARAQVVEYLEAYAARLNARFFLSTPVAAVRRSGRDWAVEAPGQTTTAPIVVMATGWADFPHLPQWPGRELFHGRVLHSIEYRNSAAFKGARVLVVGFGNSGAEIALDLAENGVDVTLSQRSPVRVLPRDLLGVPILEFALAQRLLPPRLADFINAPILRLAVGSLEKLGFETAAKGPMRMLVEDGRAPVLDIGALKYIRSGAIKVRGAIRAFTREGVAFAHGDEQRFDAVVMATGFKPDLRALLPDARGVLDIGGKPTVGDRQRGAGALFHRRLPLGDRPVA
jgi:cation diffusion facilitator CzcD-associated flavoprotein CzcO